MIFRKLEQKIIKDLNESGMSIDAVYFIMKSIMAEIEQQYFEFCRQEDVEATQKVLESNQTNEELAATNNKEERAN